MITRKEFEKEIKDLVKEEYQQKYNLEEVISKCFATNTNLCEVRSTFSKTGNTVTFEVMDQIELD